MDDDPRHSFGKEPLRPDLVQGERVDHERRFRGAFDAKASTSDLEYLATLLPDEWMATAATGTPEERSAAILHQAS